MEIRPSARDERDVLARVALWQAGHDYDHGTGHGVGAYLGVHEGPHGLSRRATTPIVAGVVLSNEPGYYREGAFGIRLENLMATMPATTIAGGDRPMLGFETLTLAPIDRRLIDPTLLNSAQIAWLDAYHARVLGDIGPLVSAECQSWLEAACAPISSCGVATQAGTPMSEGLRIEPAPGHYVLRGGGAVIGETKSAVWLHAPGHPPELFLPRANIAMEFLDPSDTTSHSPQKGDACYFSIVSKSVVIRDVAWSYETPLPEAEAIAGMLSFDDDKVTVERI